MLMLFSVGTSPPTQEGKKERTFVLLAVFLHEEIFSLTDICDAFFDYNSLTKFAFINFSSLFYVAYSVVFAEFIARHSCVQGVYILVSHAPFEYAICMMT